MIPSPVAARVALVAAALLLSTAPVAAAAAARPAGKMLFRVPWGAGTGEAGLMLDAESGLPVDSPFSKPGALFVDRTGYILFTDPINFRVQRWSPAGRFDRAFRVPPLAPGGRPRLLADVAVAPDGRIALLDFTEGAMHLAHLDGRFERFEAPPGALAQPVAVGVHGDEFAFYDVARRGTVILAADGSFRRLYPEPSQVHAFAGVMAGVERRGDRFAALLYDAEETPRLLFEFPAAGLDYAEILALHPTRRTLVLCAGGAGFRELRAVDFSGRNRAMRRLPPLTGRGVRDVVVAAPGRALYLVDSATGLEIHETTW